MGRSVKDCLERLLVASENWRFTVLKNWSTIMGSLVQQARVERMYDDMIVIGVYEVHWMQEFYMLSHVIIRKINEHAGENRIKKLRFKLIGRSQERVQKKKISGVCSSKKGRIITSREKEVLSSVRDVHLQQVLLRLFERIQE